MEQVVPSIELDELVLKEGGGFVDFVFGACWRGLNENDFHFVGNSKGKWFFQSLHLFFQILWIGDINQPLPPPGWPMDGLGGLLI